MAYIPLPTQETLRLLLDYNPETGVLRWNERSPDMFNPGRLPPETQCAIWNKQFANRQAFTAKWNGYAVGTINRKKLNAHRVIWKWMTGEDPDQIDHINRRRDDNRWVNLRSVSNLQNSHNLSQKNSSSGHTGVYRRERDNIWVAMIGVEGRQVYLGSHHTLRAAVAARKNAEKIYGFTST